MPGRQTQGERMAVLETKMEHATRALDELVAQGKAAADSRRRVYETQEAMRIEVHGMKNSIDSLERRVGAIEPSVEDYRTKVIQVNMAGKLGRLVWGIGGFVLASAVWLAAQWDKLMHFFNRPPP